VATFHGTVVLQSRFWGVQFRVWFQKHDSFRKELDTARCKAQCCPDNKQQPSCTFEQLNMFCTSPSPAQNRKSWLPGMKKEHHSPPSFFGGVLATSRDGNDAGVTESMAPTQGDLVCSAPA